MMNSNRAEPSTSLQSLLEISAYPAAFSVRTAADMADLTPLGLHLLYSISLQSEFGDSKWICVSSVPSILLDLRLAVQIM
jgi:hypothetical protein